MHIHVHGLTRDDNGDLIEAGEQGTNGAQRADGRVGGKLVMVLPGDATSYYIAHDGQGRACLYRSVESDDLLDPGTVSIKSKTLSGDQRRAVARDARRSFSLLSGINRKNAAFWSGR